MEELSSDALRSLASLKEILQRLSSAGPGAGNDRRVFVSLNDIEHAKHVTDELAQIMPLLVANKIPPTCRHLHHTFLDFPNEIWKLIIEFCGENEKRQFYGTPLGLPQLSRVALAKLCLVNRAFHQRYTPFLYSSVWLADDQQLRKFHNTVLNSNSRQFVRGLAVEFGFVWANDYCPHLMRDILRQVSPTLQYFHFDRPLALKGCSCPEGYDSGTELFVDLLGYKNATSIITEGSSKPGAPFGVIEEFYHRGGTQLPLAIWENWKRLRVLRLEGPTLNAAFVSAIMSLEALTDIVLLNPHTHTGDALPALQQLLTHDHPRLQHIVLDSVMAYASDRWFVYRDEATDISPSMTGLSRDSKEPPPPEPSETLGENNSSQDQEEEDSSEDDDDDASLKPHHDSHNERRGDPFHWSAMITRDAFSENDDGSEYLESSSSGSSSEGLVLTDTDSEISYGQNTEDLDSDDAINESADVRLRTLSLGAAIHGLSEGSETANGIRPGLQVLYRPVEEYNWFDACDTSFTADKRGDGKQVERTKEMEGKRLRFVELCAVDWVTITQEGPPAKCVLFRGRKKIASNKRMPTGQWNAQRLGGW